MGIFRTLLETKQKEQEDNGWWKVLLDYPDWETLEKAFMEYMEPYRDPDTESEYIIPFYPPLQSVFHCFEICPLEKTHIILMGQDPYIHEGEAMGLCFSVPSSCKQMPPSLRNMFKELKMDLGVDRTDMNLTDWGRQGILMINATLTVLAGKSNSHKSIWLPFTKWLFEEKIPNLWKGKSLLMVLWGKDAQMWKRKEFDSIESVHPSPLSASRGFFGSKPYSKIQIWLTKHGYKDIVFG
jgi:uracil-DNA glycosylase